MSSESADADRDKYGPLQDRADAIGLVGGSVRYASVTQYFEVAEVPHRVIDRYTRGGRVLTLYGCRLQGGQRWVTEFRVPLEEQRWVVWVFDDRPDRETIGEAAQLELEYGRRFLNRKSRH